MCTTGALKFTNLPWFFSIWAYMYTSCVYMYLWYVDGDTVEGVLNLGQRKVLLIEVLISITGFLFASTCTCTYTCKCTCTLYVQCTHTCTCTCLCTLLSALFMHTCTPQWSHTYAFFLWVHCSSTCTTFFAFVIQYRCTCTCMNLSVFTSKMKTKQYNMPEAVSSSRERCSFPPGNLTHTHMVFWYLLLILLLLPLWLSLLLC